MLKRAIIRSIGINNAVGLYRTTNRTVRKLLASNDGYKQIQKLRELSVPDKHTFFGYYDKTPFCKNDKYVLATVAPLINRSPDATDELLVGHFKIGDDSFNVLGKTTTWCWQQSCRMQWLLSSDALVIYNKIINNKYGSVVQNVKTKEIIDKHVVPIYDIDDKGENAITLDFSRLGRLRPGYGYTNIPDDTIGDLCPEDNGVWLYNLPSKENKLLFSLKSLSNFAPHPSMTEAEHYINHLKFCSCGKRFMFFHLWIKDNKRYSRLFTSDTEGKNLHLLNNDGMVSHYTWKNCDELLVFSYHNDTGTNYHLYDDSNQEKRIFGKDILREDGHPNFSVNGALLTDTYPDKYGDRKLLLFSENKQLLTLGRYYSPIRYQGEMRCDLHPRWDNKGRYICFDSAHEGRRKMYILDTSLLE